ncbi:hypothetical protein [Hymenobacter tenuis]
MPVQLGYHEYVKMKVNDRYIGGARFEQEAYVHKFYYQQQLPPEGEVGLRMEVWVYMTETSPEKYGQLFQGKGIENPYKVEFLADNGTLVEFPSGRILGERAKMTPQAWNDLCNDPDIDSRYQGDWFEWARNTVPIVFADMMLQHVEAAIAMKHYE